MSARNGWRVVACRRLRRSAPDRSPGSVDAGFHSGEDRDLEVRATHRNPRRTPAPLRPGPNVPPPGGRIQTAPQRPRPLRLWSQASWSGRCRTYFAGPARTASALF